jgi:hypothetical protein
LKTDGSLWFWGGVAGTRESPENVTESEPVKVWDDETWTGEGYIRFTRGLYSFEHNGAIKSDGSLWAFVRASDAADPSDYDGYSQFSENLAAVKLDDGVVFAYEGMWVKSDGSLWVGLKRGNAVWEPKELLPAGTIAVRGRE